MDQHLKSINDLVKKKIKKIRNFNLKDQDFLYLKLSQVLCCIYILISVLMNLDSSRNAGVIENKLQVFFLVMSKVSAYSMYPLLVVIFISKCRATLNFINKTPISLFIQKFCTDSHSYHIYAGYFIAYSALVHMIFHILRWLSLGKMQLLVNSRTGVTGLICIIVLPFITFIMMYLKRRFQYEVRKAIHYLYYIFALSLCYHVPISRLPSRGFLAPVMTTVLIWYTLDVTYVLLFMTEKIHTPVFQVLESGVQITMTVSRSFQERLEQGGYVYICLPWINKEWHAFSLFEVPDYDNQRQVFIQNVGNWTNELFQYLKRNTHRPLWIQGPFASSFHHAHNYDNQILVATGIGITPILSTAQAFAASRRVNMIWIVREPDILEFYLEYLSINTDGWLMAFYTGNKPLSPLLEEYWSHTNVRIIKGRPDLNVLIPGLIYGIENGVGLPEAFYHDKKERAIQDIMKLYNEVENAEDDENDDILEEAFSLARKHGFQLTALIQEMERKNREQNPQIRLRLSKRIRDALSDTANGDENFRTSMRTSMKQPRDALSNSYHDGDEQFRTSIHASMKQPPELKRASSKNLITEVFKNYKTHANKNKTLKMKRRPSTYFVPTEISYEPWKLNTVAPEYVKNVDKQVLDTWGLVFCGRNASVSKMLHNVANEYDIAMIEESYEW